MYRERGRVESGEWDVGRGPRELSVGYREREEGGRAECGYRERGGGVEGETEHGV